VPATALAATPKVSFNDIEDEVMCATCHVPLNIAESPQADQERVEIRRLIAQGLTKKQILSSLVAEYGDAVLADPPDHGFNITTWLVPAAVLAFVLAALAFVVPRWRDRDEPTASDDGPSLSPESARRLEEDLARFDV
jgi:cytochrome c-type biogenesis protein CcmH